VSAPPADRHDPDIGGDDGILVVSEIFGPTFQGEGPSSGRRAMFLRLGRCNLDCTWCDTPYTWDWTRFDPDRELHRRTAADVVAELAAIDAPLLVVTGGEPMLQQRRLVPVLETAAAHGWRVEVETNGTVAPHAPIVTLVDQWNVSPKLSGSGVAFARRWHPDVLQAFAATGRAVLKFVVASTSEFDEVAAAVEVSGITDVWVMPEGTDAATVRERMALLAPAVLDRGWNLSGRLHVQLWGDERGR